MRWQAQRDTALDWQRKEPRALHLTGAEKSPLASRTSSRTLWARHVFRHRRYLSQGTLLPQCRRLQVLHRGLLTVTRDYEWQLEAWAVFSNHYHFVAHSPEHENSAESLSAMLGLLHEKTAKWINRLDDCRGRQVWHNFWETKLTYQKSYLARLNYVHQNPVKHRLVVSQTSILGARQDGSNGLRDRHRLRRSTRLRQIG